MNILNAVFGDSTGGRWSATLKTARLLAERGHSVTLLIDPADLPNVPADFVGPGLDVVTMRNSGHYDLIASWKAARLIRAHRIDAVIAHSGRAIHMLKRAAPRTVPVIAFNHSHNIKRTLNADAFFCITPYMKQIVDAATGRCRIANAGQCSPVLVDLENGARPVDCPAHPLGCVKKPNLATCSLDLPGNGCVVLHSDGLVEALDRHGTPVDYDRFYRFIAEGWTERTTCTDVIPRILDRVRAVTDPVPWADDATIVLIGFRG